MDTEIAQWAGVGGIPLVQALVAVMKTMIPGLPARYYPGLSIFWGIVLNVALSYLLKGDYGVAVFVGVITGLASSGVFAYGKQKEIESNDQIDKMYPRG